jgi:hypothetical protein
VLTVLMGIGPLIVATGADGYQFHRDHRRPRARPQDGAQISALA